MGNRQTATHLQTSQLLNPYTENLPKDIYDVFLDCKNIPKCINGNSECLDCAIQMND
jgi:hypothetical protein